MTRILSNAYNKQNRVLVAIGNENSDDCTYPACNLDVLAVAAVDINNTVFPNSGANSFVDLAAPGVNILSTIPRFSTITISTPNAASKYTAEILLNTPVLKTGLKGKLVSCGLGTEVCTNVTGGICLIQRGLIYFHDKAINCQMGGGKAAIIVNNRPGLIGETTAYDPTYNTSALPKIPVYTMDQVTGSELLNNSDGAQVSIVADRGSYTYTDGNDNAAAHVSKFSKYMLMHVSCFYVVSNLLCASFSLAAGAVAAVWRSCRRCTNKQVVSCLTTTAKDLGDVGKDNSTGYGLVQTVKAYTCLKNVKKCC